MRDISPLEKDLIPPQEEDDDIDIDVCLSCGRYFTDSAALHEAWRASFNYREDRPMEQKCLRCMRVAALVWLSWAFAR